PRRAAILHRPSSQSSSGDVAWTAISATSIRGASVSGFAIQGGGTAAVEYGISITDAEVEIDDVLIEGTRLAAVRFSGSSTARLRSSDLSANAGTGIAVDAGAAPEILHNVVVGNALG